MIANPHNSAHNSCKDESLLLWFFVPYELLYHLLYPIAMKLWWVICTSGKDFRWYLRVVVGGWSMGKCDWWGVFLISEPFMTYFKGGTFCMLFRKITATNIYIYKFGTKRFIPGRWEPFLGFVVWTVRSISTVINDSKLY